MHFKPGYFKVFLVLLIIEISIATFIPNGFVRHTLGDYLVVIMLYCFFMSIFKLRPIVAAWIVLVFATVVELCQFFNVLERLGLEDNPIARIVLGSVFSYGDLLAYLFGIITVIVVEHHRVNRSS